MAPQMRPYSLQAASIHGCTVAGLPWQQCCSGHLHRVSSLGLLHRCALFDVTSQVSGAEDV